jgi:hypothetical protein
MSRDSQAAAGVAEEEKLKTEMLKAEKSTTKHTEDTKREKRERKAEN